jgi:hypothetical protein
VWVGGPKARAGAGGKDSRRCVTNTTGRSEFFSMAESIIGGPGGYIRVGKTNEFFSMAESMIGGTGEYIRAGKTNTGDKNNLFFLQKCSPNCVFMVVPPFWSSCNLTSGSGVRGKAGLNWVRKVFNCLRSL